MQLSPGDRLGPYEIVAPIGAGGMGAVYKARDTRLERIVAIKVSNEQFSERFEREAHAVASLNHPNICTLHDVGPNYLVMEFIEGHPIKGPLPLPEALKYAAQMCDALDAAHRKGITHRDLKPGNIMLTKSTVKLLDFGLAKVTAPAAESDATRTLPLTSMGMVVGTLPYMAPEQVEGKEINARTDIFAFGTVLYELITGKRPFQGDNQASLIGAILHKEVAPIEPAGLDRVIRRCLAKDPDDRWQTARDLKEALALCVLEPPPAPAPQPRRKPWAWIALASGALIGMLAAYFLIQRAPMAAMRLAVNLPAGDKLAALQYPALAISPDGSRIAYIAQGGGATKLFLRSMNEFEAKPLPGTDGAYNPFFSPDGGWVGFFTAAGKLKKVAVEGGPPMVICDALNGSGGVWAENDSIYLSPSWNSGIARVSASGGKPDIVTQLDHTKGERSHAWPALLPGGETLLFTAGRATSFEQASVQALSLKTGQRRILIENGVYARYIPTGHLLYIRGGNLLAVPFDPSTLALKGTPIPVVQGVMSNPSSGSAQFAFSANGRLAYAAGSGEFDERSLVAVDRQGKVTSLSEIHRAFEDMCPSPDGKRVALTIEGPTWGIWIYDFDRGTLTRFTFDNDSRDPRWSPDGKRIAYGSFRDGRYGVFWKPADGSGKEERLTPPSEHWQYPDVFSPDGRVLLYGEEGTASNNSIWSLSLEGERKATPVLHAKNNFSWLSLSPDGGWLAYTSDESGREEVYVQAWPLMGGKWLISADGGSRALWSRDGRELYYRKGTKVMSVGIETKPTFAAGKARLLFEGEFQETGHDYDLFDGGARFLFIKELEQKSNASQINIVQNWFDDVKRQHRSR